MGAFDQMFRLQFDRELGLRFVTLGRERKLEHVVGHSDIGIPLHECVMCGPTLVVRRDQSAGGHVYCRSCGGEYLATGAAGNLTLEATGRTGSPHDLEPEVDTALVASVVRESARALLSPA